MSDSSSINGSSLEESVSTAWKELVDWVKCNGGYVNEALELRNVGENNRGVFAKKAMQKGKLLIQVPESILIDGRRLPSSYSCSEAEERHVSNWLRCIGAFYQAIHYSGDQEDKVNKKPYILSLPKRYDTLASWSDEELSVLQGTSAPAGTWKVEREVLLSRFHTQILPYLQEVCGINDWNGDTNSELEEFMYACQTLSTRGFHLELNASSNQSAKENHCYSGPFLIPVIDLLNHSVSNKCTTLERTGDAFLMIAERSIESGEEILHSYGDNLTACQFLHTFGFVPSDICVTAAGVAVLSKETVLESCQRVIQSSFPTDVARSMQLKGMKDDVWECQNPAERSYDHLANDYVVEEASPLTDELMTLACLPFLPEDAYDEVYGSTLDRTVLQDYFLCRLVCQALLLAVRSKESSYSKLDESELIRDVAKSSILNRGRLSYALSIRAQEKKAMDALRQALLVLSSDLQEEGNTSENALMVGAKRQKLL